MSQSTWAKAKVSRFQQYLAAPTLDDIIPEDDEIRLFDALLNELDWSLWERKYRRGPGQPPIHPRLVAGTIIFALSRRIQSSRQIEEATRRRIDLIWFLEGRSIDHSTICSFREKFADLLPCLFEELARKAAQGPEAGRCLAVDGTRIRANSDRHGSRTAASLNRRLAELAEKRLTLLEQMACLDALEDLEQGCEMPGGDDDDRSLRTQLQALDAKREKVLRALQQAQERDALKRQGGSARITPTRVPLSDPDAYLLPNKEGGYAPNYSPTLAVDVPSGAIIDAQVPDGADEAGTLGQSIQASEQCLGRKAETLLCDGAFTSGATLKDIEQQDVVMCAPPPLAQALSAEREDLSQAIDAESLDELPSTGRGTNKRFAREAFVYHQSQDCYYCPQGRALRCVSRDKRRDKNGNVHLRWRYQRNDCSDCPLRSRCLKGNARRRAIVRDEYQEYSDRLAMRMSQSANQELYKKRAPVVEGAFGYIKHVMGFRRFLRRGMPAVRNEWQWICTAFNVSKILRYRLTHRTIAPDPPGGCAPNAGCERPQGSPNGSQKRWAIISKSILTSLHTIRKVFARSSALGPTPRIHYPDFARS